MEGRIWIGTISKWRTSLGRVFRLGWMLSPAVLAIAAAGCGGGGGNLGPSRIAFFSNRTGTGEVWVMDMNGANLVNVSAGQGDGHVWDPFGTKIAFVSNRTGNWDVWLVNANGTGLTQLSNDSSVEGDLDWKPSGGKLVYVKSGVGLVERDLVTNTETLLTNAGSFFLTPKYSPSGAEIVFAWSPTGTDIEIAKIPSAGGPPTNLTNDSANQDTLPRWSPNGQQIAWLKAGNLWVMDANGANQTQLTNTGNVTWLAFSPNGQFLAYVDNGDIWRLTWSGTSWGSPVQLTTTGDNFTPCWTADSLAIVFMSLRSGNAEIWRMRFDGSGQINLTNHAAVDEEPQCSP